MKERKERTALTDHQCIVCHCIIHAGERYVLEMERDDDNKTVRTCKHITCSERTKDNA